MFPHDPITEFALYMYTVPKDLNIQCPKSFKNYTSNIKIQLLKLIFIKKKLNFKFERSTFRWRGRFYSMNKNEVFQVLLKAILKHLEKIYLR